MNTDCYFKLLSEILENCNTAEYLQLGYSGRGMYGAKCDGIVGSDFIDIIETAAANGLTGAKYDNMGHDYIVYWPHPVFSDEAYEKYGEQVDPN